MRPIVLAFAIALAAALGACKSEPERIYLEAAQIVERNIGALRYEDGKKKWELLEVLGPEGPYSDDVAAAPMSLSNGQRGTFRHGDVEGTYGGMGDQNSHMGIPVRNQAGEAALIICRTVVVE